MGLQESTTRSRRWAARPEGRDRRQRIAASRTKLRLLTPNDINLIFLCMSRCLRRIHCVVSISQSLYVGLFRAVSCHFVDRVLSLVKTIHELTRKIAKPEAILFDSPSLLNNRNRLAIVPVFSNH